MGVNRRFVLAQRPEGVPDARTFLRDDVAIPEPGEGEILVRNVFIPVDPGMRPALTANPIGVDAFEAFPIGALVGYMTVGAVIESRDPAFKPGDWVTDMMMWQDYAVTSGKTARKIDAAVGPTAALGILGIPGLSAWAGLVCLAAPQPGETVVVTSAAGAVGSIAGQIAKNIGCRVVGVAGGADKCAWLVSELGFDAAVDYRAEPDIGAAVRRACPEGVDILFDNVGNASIDALMPLLRINGRITICGQVAEYNLPLDQRPGIHNTGRFVSHRLSMRGLFVYDHAAHFPEALATMAGWAAKGRLTLKETIIDGFDNIPAAFASLFTGKAAGRTIVRIDAD